MASTEPETGFIVTATQAYVSRAAQVEGARQVELKGRTILQPGVTLSGEDAVVRVGRYVHIQTGTTIRPARAPPGSPKSHVPVLIGSHTVIGKDCQIKAAAIGSYCWIGDEVTLGERVILKDCCVVASGTVIPDDTVVPPFTRMSGGSARDRLLEWTELPPSMQVELQEGSIESFQDFVAEHRRQQ